MYKLPKQTHIRKPQGNTVFVCGHDWKLRLNDKLISLRIEGETTTGFIITGVYMRLKTIVRL